MATEIYPIATAAPDKLTLGRERSTSSKNQDAYRSNINQDDEL
jgi:hypothetical protein